MNFNIRKLQSMSNQTEDIKYKELKLKMVFATFVKHDNKILRPQVSGPKIAQKQAVWIKNI